MRFYGALANNESAVRELTDETLKKIAHELAENLRKNLTLDWSARESVQAKLRLMVKRILRKYRYPPDQQDAAMEVVLQQAKALGEAWASPCSAAGDNLSHVRSAFIFSGALRLALAQAISLIDLLRPYGRLGPHPARRAGLASDTTSGYQSGYGRWVSRKTPEEANSL